MMTLHARSFAHRAAEAGCSGRTQPSLWSHGCCRQACRPGPSTRNVAACSGIGDDLMDYIQGGPKLRKWYGETEKLTGPKGDKDQADEGHPGDNQEDEGPRDAVLVTGADTPLGELVVLQLVLARTRIRILVKDIKKAKNEFGPYVEPVRGDASNASALREALRGVRAIVVTGAVGDCIEAAAARQIDHVVLASCTEQGAGLLGGLFGGADAALRGAGREAALRAAGLPHTIVRFSQIQDCAGGASYIEFSQADDAAPGPIAREDAALVLARALAFPPARAQGVAFAAGSAGPGVPPSKEEWGDMFGRLNATVSAVAVP